MEDNKSFQILGKVFFRDLGDLLRGKIEITEMGQEVEILFVLVKCGQTMVNCCNKRTTQFFKFLNSRNWADELFFKLQKNK